MLNDIAYRTFAPSMIAVPEWHADYTVLCCEARIRLVRPSKIVLAARTFGPAAIRDFRFKRNNRSGWAINPAPCW